MFDVIKTIADAYGPSGREDIVAGVLADMMKGYADEVRRDAMGNLICIRKGSEGGRRVLLSAHMDQIGLIVVAAEKEGYLRVMPVGGISWDTMHETRVVFENGVTGVVSCQPLKGDEKQAPKHFYIDVGAESDEEALKMVSLGDVAVYQNGCCRLGANRVTSQALDDRIACALLVEVMRALPKGDDTVMAVFSTQEEVGCRGARTAAYALDPDVAIALDVTGNGDTPEEKLPAVKLGAGACVKIMDRGSISNPQVVKDLLAAGEQAGVPTQREVLPYGGTDAMAMQIAKAGVSVCTVSIPCRYVHSACEVIDLRDVDGAKQLLLKYLR